MGFREALFGGDDDLRFKQTPEKEGARVARNELITLSHGGLLPVPTRRVVDLPDQGPERKLARETATELAAPSEQENFFELPEVQGIIKRTVDEGNLLSNRLGRGLQKTGGFASTPGRDMLGRSVSDIESRIAAELAPFAESQRARKFADKTRRANVANQLEGFGFADETRELTNQQAKLDVIFNQEFGTLKQQEEVLIPMLQRIITDSPKATPFIKGGQAGLVDQMKGLVSIMQSMQQLYMGAAGAGGGGGPSGGTPTF